MTRAALSLLWIAGIALLVALGVWQVERRAWKHGLIAQVEAGARAAPIDAPARARPGDAYRRVRVSGRYLRGKDSFVQAATVRGPGYWVLTPFVTSAGRTVLINRGFVTERRAADPVCAVGCSVTGLIRLSEPGGGFLRSNDPAADRWHSRDVVAITARRRLATVPYFIDADASSIPGQPVGGLTVIKFADNHLVYAVTWFILALMMLAGFLHWLGVRGPWPRA